jgi:hypothetical protein
MGGWSSLCRSYGGDHVNGRLDDSGGELGNHKGPVHELFQPATAGSQRLSARFLDEPDPGRHRLTDFDQASTIA